VFEPYFSTKDRGTGLGLAIVSRIVADHHGYIRVQANEPHGARFVVELPISRQGDDRNAVSGEAAPETAR
jgi:two-component system nitrogen regulation sensor histidine kinase NtrY